MMWIFIFGGFILVVLIMMYNHLVNKKINSLMKRIVDFRSKSKKNIHLSFVTSKVFVAIPYEKPLFEPRVFQSLVDFSKIQEYFEDLQIAIRIVEDLNLNLRI